MSQFKGIIVEESLDNPALVNKMRVMKVEVSLNPRWHIYTVQLSREEIHQLTKHLKAGWYAHFWKGREVVAVFKDRFFDFNYDRKETWKAALDFGSSQGIPKEQLDFPID